MVNRTLVATARVLVRCSNSTWHSTPIHNLSEPGREGPFTCCRTTLGRRDAAAGADRARRRRGDCRAVMPSPEETAHETASSPPSSPLSLVASGAPSWEVSRRTPRDRVASLAKPHLCALATRLFTRAVGWRSRRERQTTSAVGNSNLESPGLPSDSDGQRGLLGGPGRKRTSGVLQLCPISRHGQNGKCPVRHTVLVTLWGEVSTVVRKSTSSWAAIRHIGLFRAWTAAPMCPSCRRAV